MQGSTDGLLHTGADGGRVGGSSYALLCASDEDGYKFDNNSGWLNDLGCVENYDIKADEDTLAPTTHEGHEYVDLGLPSGTLWATCNVGATSAENYGDYFAWGETTTKETYDWSTYKYCNGDYKTMTKYCNNSTYGTIDNITTLEASDDAATANWGGKWRMPTVGEIYELINECTWKWRMLEGVHGYYITSKKDGTKSIFLPAAGFRETGSDIYGAEVSGHYWSASIDPNYPSTARRIYFHSDYHDGYNSDRRLGYSVRPVFSMKDTAVENVKPSNSDNVRKVIENGQIVIIRDGVRYSVLGVRL